MQEIHKRNNIYHLEKYLLVLLIYQLFGYYLGKNQIEIIVDKIFYLILPKL